MNRASAWSHALRWIAAVAVAAAVFEALDGLGVHHPGVSWITLASPVLAGGVAASLAGGRARSRLFASAALVWVRIGADRAIGLAHGVRQPLEVEAAVAAIFGIPWTALGLVGGLAVLAGLRARRYAMSRPQGSSPRVT